MNKETNTTIYFAKVKPNAIIPSKIPTNAGYDVYACFDEDYMIIQPHTTEMIPTGIASAFSEDYCIILKERGSTGIKGIGQRAGVIDSNFRGEWFVPITNTNDIPIVIYKKDVHITDLENGYVLFDKDKYVGKPILYPYEKAICQAIITRVPKCEIKEIEYEVLKEIESDRGTGCLGSSGK